MRRALVFLLGIFACGRFSDAEIPSAPPLVLTSQENGTVSQDTFLCSGNIYGYLTLPKPVIGKHVLEGIWRGPKGTVVEHSHSEVNFPSPGRRTASVWLCFTKEGGDWWNPLSIRGHGDEDRAVFEGPWKLEVRWDNHMIAQSDFQVHCL